MQRDRKEGGVNAKTHSMRHFVIVVCEALARDCQLQHSSRDKLGMENLFCFYSVLPHQHRNCKKNVLSTYRNGDRVSRQKNNSRDTAFHQQ
jgi:hypothetical protein